MPWERAVRVPEYVRPHWMREVDGEYRAGDHPKPDVDVTPNPVVARILGPDGEPLSVFREREPIGFRSGRLPR